MVQRSSWEEMEVNTISNTPVNEPKREKKKSMICFARKINQAKIKKGCRQVHPHPPIAHLVLTVSSLCRLLTGPVGRGREELRIWWFSFKGSIIFFVYTPWNPWVYMYTVPTPKRRRRKVGVFFLLLFYFDFPPVPAKFSTTQPTVFLSILKY